MNRPDRLASLAGCLAPYIHLPEEYLAVLKE